MYDSQAALHSELVELQMNAPIDKDAKRRASEAEQALSRVRVRMKRVYEHVYLHTVRHCLCSRHEAVCQCTR